MNFSTENKPIASLSNSEDFGGFIGISVDIADALVERRDHSLKINCKLLMPELRDHCRLIGASVKRGMKKHRVLDLAAWTVCQGLTVLFSVAR